ncbi:GmrSD restriction endonuclease domain-containing protein [Nodosilinea sp. AN01ver1]|uniref:GmrSD restriction endonuclease domain-containing protein n=1 Tax=Nodosilinea sp. AN01ver1 TaxID=3423362 RepID=UPI003D31D27D
MKATEVNLLKFLKQPNQFVIPIYQRTYSWTLKQCQQLWTDIIRVAQDEDVSGHFVGSIVYIEAGLYQVASVPQLLVIDGQQRLTTISLLLSALGKAIGASAEEDLEITRRKLENYFLFNNEEEGDDRYKLSLTQGDRETFIRLIEERELPKEASKRVLENYQYFESQIRRGGVDLNTLYQGLGKLIIVNISLDRDRDNPQLIFESLNSTGLDLSQADLIRNYVLMGLPTREQEEVYNRYWYPMEETFGGAEQSGQFDRFMRDYLTLKSRVGTIPNIRDVYNSFKAYIDKQSGVPVADIMADVYRYSKYYARLALGQESDPDINRALQDINTLRVEVSYPFLLEVYEDYSQNTLSKEEFIQVLRLVESYVFRRVICGIPTNSMNKTFANLGREIDREHYLESIKLAFVRKDSYKRFPSDQEFRQEFVVKDIYNFRSRSYLLRKLENHQRPKELADPENYTIEHILPQNPRLSEAWRSDLGEQWKEVQAKYLHTIGNLTLTGYNPEYSDRPFQEKRDMACGFKVSPLFLNQGLGQIEKWDETEIKDRAAKLAEWAVQIWTYPDVEVATQEPDVADILAQIFPREEDLQAAKQYIQEVVDQIGYDKIEHILAITGRSDNDALSVTLGQWLVLRFRRKAGGMEALFALDIEENQTCEGIVIEKREAFSQRWSGDKTIYLATISWNSQVQLPQDFLEAWLSAIRYAYQVFKGWNSSSYMNYHQPALAQELVAETERSRHAEYLQGEMGELFEALRKRILNLDPSVREEFKKLYIAYKTSTNFVDVVPQRSRLRLSLNMKFDEINDPKGLCRDVTDLGRWGNGDVEIGFDSMAQLNDVMALIQQAFEKHSDLVEAA